MKKILFILLLFTIAFNQDLHKYSTQEVLNIVLNDPASAINYHYYSTQEAFNIALDESNSSLKANVDGLSINSDDVLIVDGIMVLDPTSLAAESLDEVDFATHASWDVTNDLDDTGGNAAYSWTANQTSTLTQIQANLATAGVSDVLYKFTYTVTVTTAFDGDGAATITTGFAVSAVTLDLTAGTHTIYFKAKTTPVDFVISVVSGTDTEGTFTIDDVTLKQLTGGDVSIAGALWVNGVDIGTDVAVNKTHSSSDGSDHTFINQDITTTGTPVFAEFGNTAQQTITLGVGVTTFAVTSNVVQITGDGGGNTIATITGALVGVYTFIFVDGFVTISNDDSHGADSVDLDGANDLTSADDTVLQLVYDGISWYRIADSVN